MVGGVAGGQVDVTSRLRARPQHLYRSCAASPCAPGFSHVWRHETPFADAWYTGHCPGSGGRGRDVADWRVATGFGASGPARTYQAATCHDLVDMPFFIGRFDLETRTRTSKRSLTCTSEVNLGNRVCLPWADRRKNARSVQGAASGARGCVTQHLGPSGGWHRVSLLRQGLLAALMVDVMIRDVATTGSHSAT
jgi:hypothetical protein